MWEMIGRRYKLRRVNHIHISYTANTPQTVCSFAQGVSGLNEVRGEEVRSPLRCDSHEETRTGNHSLQCPNENHRPIPFFSFEGLFYNSLEAISFATD